MDFKCGGHLWTEDAQGSNKSSFLEEGFFDFLDKVLICIALIIICLSNFYEAQPRSKEDWNYK